MFEFLLVVFVFIGLVVLDMRSQHRFARLEDRIITEDTLEEKNKNLKKSIKDSLNSKKKWETDGSMLVENVVQIFKAGHCMYASSELDGDFIWKIAVNLYGEDRVCSEPVMHKKDPYRVEAYKIYIQ